jgi:hypothetical protein
LIKKEFFLLPNADWRLPIGGYHNTQSEFSNRQPAIEISKSAIANWQMAMELPRAAWCRPVRPNAHMSKGRNIEQVGVKTSHVGFD